jgi:hypothetical protein
MFEGNFSPPVYNDLYNFLDGAQNDIFTDSYTSIPTPAPNASLPVLSNLSGTNSSSSSIPSTPNSNPNSTTSTLGKTCKQKTTASASASLSSTGKYFGARDMRRSHQSSIMAMSRRSRRLNVNKHERSWNMF